MEASVKPLLVTVRQTQALISLGNTKFYELVNEGKIRTTKIGRRTLVNYADLEALTERRAT